MHLFLRKGDVTFIRRVVEMIATFLSLNKLDEEQMKREYGSFLDTVQRGSLQGYMLRDMLIYSIQASKLAGGCGAASSDSMKAVHS